MIKPEFAKNCMSKRTLEYIKMSITSCLQESSVDVVRRQLQCFATRMDELLLLGSYK